MATRANIIVKVPTDYIGKYINFDPSKLHTIVGHGANIDGKWQAVPDEVRPRPTMVITKPYLSLYNHSDGYPTELGKRLLTHYNDLDKALNLLSGGWIGGLYDEYYHAAADDPEWGGIDDYMPTQHDKDPGLQEAYAYLWKDGEWYVTTWSLARGTRWAKLADVLASNNPDLED